MTEALTDEELAQLRTFLDERGELSLAGLDGFATGLAVAPVPIAEAAWCEVLTEVLTCAELPGQVVSLVARHVEHHRAALKGVSFVPLISDELTDAVEWSAGFLGATELFSEILEETSDEDEVVDLMLPMVILGTDEGLEALEASGLELAEDLAESIGSSVSQLARLLEGRHS